jgi:hypothetical protein
VEPAASKAELPPLTIVCRAVALLTAEGLSVGLALGLLLVKPSVDRFLVENVLGPGPRSFVLGMGIGGALLAAALAVAFAVRKRDEPASAQRLLHVAQRLAPLGVAAFLPALFRWQAWTGRDLAFLTLVGLAVIVFEVGLRTALAVGPLPQEQPLIERARRAREVLSTRWPRLWSRLPLILVCSGAMAYALYFAYYTCAFHWGVRSGFDLGWRTT